MAKAPGEEIRDMHLDADFRATGADHAKTLTDSFANHGLMYGADPSKSHSLGYRGNVRKGDIAKSLLGRDRVEQVHLDEMRPLIDLLNEATFSDSVSMQYVADKYMLRSLLRKAHCFTLDAETSALTADFSVAIARDLEAVRHLAVPPFPVTWFEIDNVARLQRIKQHGVQLTESARSDDVCPRVGWLIHPSNDLHIGGYYATYCTVISQGIVVAPLSFFWHTDAQAMDDGTPYSSGDLDVQMVCFGTRQSGVNRLDAFPATTPFHLHYGQVHRHSTGIRDLMLELSGELRHIWGLLLALGAGQLGAATTTTPQPLPTGAPPMAKGKPVLPLEHKVLTIKLSKRATVEKVTAKAITGIKHRWHEVRGHYRTKYNADGSVKWRIHIEPHARGDERLGKIEKTYKVER